MRHRTRSPAAAHHTLAGRSASSPPPAPSVTPPVARETLPEVFESPDFIVAFAKPGDTPASLAERHLGDATQGG